MPLCTDICTTIVSIDYDASRATARTFALHDTAPPTGGLVHAFCFYLMFYLAVYIHTKIISKNNCLFMIF